MFRSQTSNKTWSDKNKIVLSPSLQETQRRQTWGKCFRVEGCTVLVPPAGWCAVRWWRRWVVRRGSVLLGTWHGAHQCGPHQHSPGWPVYTVTAAQLGHSPGPDARPRPRGPRHHDTRWGEGVAGRGGPWHGGRGSGGGAGGRGGPRCAHPNYAQQTSSAGSELAR